MTIPTGISGTAGSSANGALLETLLKEGLTASNADNAKDSSRYRKLLGVLLHTCILDPVKRSGPLVIDIDQARTTLIALRKQTSSHPEILASLPPLNEPQIPFYKWLIPRLIRAAVRLEEETPTSPLVYDILLAVGNVFAVIGRDLSSAPSTSLTGPLKVTLALRQMITFCESSLNRQTPVLFGFAPLSTSSLSVMLTLHVILLSPAYFTGDLAHRVGACLSKVGETSGDLSQKRQARFALTVSQALRSVPHTMSLTAACVAIAQWDDVNTRDEDQRRRESINLFYSTLRSITSQIRLEVWWKLFAQLDEVTIGGDNRILRLPQYIHLLTPIPPELPASVILRLIKEDIVNAWATSHDLNVMGTMGTLFRNLARDLTTSRPSTSQKRKRDDGKISPFLRVWPELASERPLSALRTLMESHRDFDVAKLSASLPIILCSVSGCCDGHVPSLDEDALDLWQLLLERSHGGGGPFSLTVLKSLRVVLSHSNPAFLAPQLHQTKQKMIIERVVTAMVSPDRQTRVAASSILSIMYKVQGNHPRPSIGARYRKKLLNCISGNNPLYAQETHILFLADLGKIVEDAALEPILLALIVKLGSPSAPLRSLAYTQLLVVAKSRQKTPYNLLSPHLESISVLLVRSIDRNSDIVVETMQFIGFSRRTFFDLTLKYTLPALVTTRDRPGLDAISSITGKALGLLLVDNITEVLAQMLLGASEPQQGFSFLVSILRQLATPDITISSLMVSCIVPLIVTLAVELGNEDNVTAGRAREALLRAQKQQRGGDPHEDDLGNFLKPHMLGVISQLNDMLHDIQGKKTVAFKCKIIRSLGQLITMVGDSMSSFSPQIIASFQSTIGIPEFRTETLRAWAVFIHTLRYVDVGPFVGQTTAALVSLWAAFSAEDRGIATAIIKGIAENNRHWSAYQDDVVALDGIPELTHAARKLTAYRQEWTIRERITKLLDRGRSKNIAVATISMRELRDHLRDNAKEVSQLPRGDTFDRFITDLGRRLLLASTRDGDCSELRNLSHECLGMVGALDPDRFSGHTIASSVTVMSNFTDRNESIDFAIHLVRDVLVDAFRATNDTKHQNHLAFAIQELLQFAEFTPKILQAHGGVPVRVRARWQSIPKDQHETLAPLLESRFTINEQQFRPVEHPIYPHSRTYREWLQTWTTDLIGSIYSTSSEARGTNDSKAIFGVIRGVLKNQDVTVAHHILPHVVLTLLLSNVRSVLDDVCAEIVTVLQDQVNSSSAATADKRMLSSQVIFGLMDHLSKWLRQQRVVRSEKPSPHVKIVEHVLAGIETELMANAALQSKAYARSLRSFEQRIVKLRSEGRENDDLQEYFEKLHQIYAELEEPDGMEGLSTFVISPSLEHQIREHESTGRWTSAQSCWEVRLQQSPDDISLHVGLLRCLKNLGHYDTLRTHVRGVLSRHPDWTAELAAFETEAAWIIGDWKTVEKIGHSPMAKVFLAMSQREDTSAAAHVARQQFGAAITSSEYSRSIDPILGLHLLREIEMISKTDLEIAAIRDPVNRPAIQLGLANTLTSILEQRLSAASPAFRVREAILSVRRTAFSLSASPLLRREIGLAWVATSKLARKAGYEQTSYSATLQAQEANAPFTFLQQAKLSKAHGGAYKALTELENALGPVLKAQADDRTAEAFSKDRELAKVVLVKARWSVETERFEANEIIRRYQSAIQLAPSLESPYYHLGHFYDTLAGTPEISAAYHQQTCHNYIQALAHGVKYIYRTMPRLLTLWLDLGEVSNPKKSTVVNDHLKRMNAMIDKARKELPAYQFLTAFPQIVSRIVHPDRDVSLALHKIMATVVAKYPKQASWPMVGVMQSNRPERKSACKSVIQRAKMNASAIQVLDSAELLSQRLLRLADDKIEDRKREMSIATSYAYVLEAFPSTMIVPLQDALTCTLPAASEAVKTHNAFPFPTVELKVIEDKIDIMPSLQKPKKLVFVGSNGKRYPFLCKPHDDLRKDARLMDFNSMINTLLKRGTESRRRQLYIRTYAVMSLNEECGLIEWVSNTNALKNILEQGYLRQNKRIWPSDLPRALEQVRKQGHAAQIDYFKRTVLPLFRPSVFVDWFLMTWPEPSAWLAARMAYSRTLAVMSMIGYVLGLGDRHGENILFDGLSGDTVHVDLNCLFEKGQTFEIPERVPFRLTHNMVDAMGVTGVEGPFRKAAEITLGILRTNSESLMSVLEAFVHDPLVEWTKSRSKPNDVRTSAERNLGPIRDKLRGVPKDIGVTVTVANQVEGLIKQATSPNNLGLMYQGWAPWL